MLFRSVYAAPNGLHLNPAAYRLPVSGTYGNAGRGSITGPSQFTMNSSVSRTFRITDRYSADLQISANNVLNHVNYTSWNTVTNSAQFGVPTSASQMRLVQTTLRLRF